MPSFCTLRNGGPAGHLEKPLRIERSAHSSAQASPRSPAPIR
jgi:hypothetical protein